MPDALLVDAVARRLYEEGGGAAEPSVWSGPTWDELPDSPLRRDCLVRARYMLDVVRLAEKGVAAS